jgi:molybdate transport system ATP-binding protein
VLVASLAKRFGGFALDLEFSAAPGSTTVLVGESGAGKTSVLRLLAGLVRPDQGRITIDEEIYFDSHSKVNRPAWQRDVGYVSQDYALFPHLTVWQNVGFGLQALGLATASSRARITQALQAAGIAELEARLPTQLSGGQQQRVALARALVLNPRLLLLDEPLSAVDLQTRRAVRTELRGLLERLSCVTVYVTHSPVEALIFGDQIVVLDRGRISQMGSREELLQHPRTPFVAELMGTNLFVGTMRGRVDTVAPRLHTAEGDLVLSSIPGTAEVFATVNPREITIYRQMPEASAQNAFAGPILELAPEPPAGERIRVVLGTTPSLVAEVTREAVIGLGLKEGLFVYASFKATGVNTYV